MRCCQTAWTSCATSCRNTTAKSAATDETAKGRRKAVPCGGHLLWSLLRRLVAIVLSDRRGVESEHAGIERELPLEA